MKKHFNEEPLMTKEYNEHFKDVDNDVKVRDHCHITGQCRSPAHRDSVINLKLNHKIPVVFHNLK